MRLSLLRQAINILSMYRLSSDKAPIELVSDISSPEGTATASGPFIYDPKRKQHPLSATVAFFQEDLAEFYVTLRNPFLFDLEIQGIELR